MPPNNVQVTIDSSAQCKNDCYMIADVTNHIYTNGGTSDLQPTPYVFNISL